MTYQEWISALLADARDYGLLDHILNCSDTVLQYFYELGIQPQVHAILNESEGIAA